MWPVETLELAAWILANRAGTSDGGPGHQGPATNSVAFLGMAPTAVLGSSGPGVGAPVSGELGILVLGVSERGERSPVRSPLHGQLGTRVPCPEAGAQCIRIRSSAGSRTTCTSEPRASPLCREERGAARWPLGPPLFKPCWRQWGLFRFLFHCKNHQEVTHPRPHISSHRALSPGCLG